MGGGGWGGCIEFDGFLGLRRFCWGEGGGGWESAEVFGLLLVHGSGSWGGGLQGFKGSVED